MTNDRAPLLRTVCAGLSRLAGPAMVIALWALSSAWGWIPPYILPGPWPLFTACIGFVFGVGWDSAHAGQFWAHAAASLARVFSGFFLASALGVLAGLICGRIRIVATLVDPIVQLVRSIPGITWLPIAMVWFGIGTATTVFLITMAAFFPVYISTLHGVREVPAIWIRAARSLGARNHQIIWRVVLPGAYPSIRAGLRIALGVSWAYVVLGELTGVNWGLGAMIMDARMMGDVPVILVGMVFIAALGLWCDLILVKLTGPGKR